MSRLNWVLNGFITTDLYAPYVVAKDADYYNDLRNKYSIIYDKAKNAGADSESLRIIEEYRDSICNAILLYYEGRITAANSKVNELVKHSIDNRFALSSMVNSDAFRGVKGTELQLFRGRICKGGITYAAKDMLHIPFSLRGITKNNRFSISGLPCIYIGNTSYVCWLELGCPIDGELAISPIIADDNIKIFNLAVMNRDFFCLSDLDDNAVHSWIKLLMLMMATSYRVTEENRFFHSEYIISQAIMLACHELGIDGVAYYSDRTEDHVFASVAINIALLASYKYGQEYSDICKHLKVGDSFNYGFYKQLGIVERSKHHEYPLRCLRGGVPANLGSYARQYEYANTEFCEFDRFVFGEWKKETIEFGNALQVL